MLDVERRDVEATRRHQLVDGRAVPVDDVSLLSTLKSRRHGCGHGTSLWPNPEINHLVFVNYERRQVVTDVEKRR